jgi:sugar phosphate isomerase/epimerase
VIKDLDPRWLGVQFDIRHAVVEGGESWVNDFALIKDFVRCSVAKDFYWKKTESGWKINNVPMGEGMVDFVKYYKMYKDFGLDGPISLHIEYDIFDQPEETLSKQEKMKFARQVLAKDIQHLKDALAKAGLE